MVGIQVKMLYDLIQSALDGRTTSEALIEQLAELMKSAECKDGFHDMIADVLVLTDIETGLADKERRDLYLEITKTILRNELLPITIAHERFDIETNVQIGVIQDKRQFTVNYNRLRTKLYFKQKKYNLLREENEGFARLMTALMQLNRKNVKEVLKTIIEIVGAYHVDPNRILDLILEVFQYNSSDYEPYLDLIKDFYGCQNKITQLILLKLSFYTSTKSEYRMVPQPFYRMIAILIKKEILDMEDIYPFLLPDDGKVLDYHQKLVEEAKGLARKYNVAVVGDEKTTKTVIETLKEEDTLAFHLLEIDNQKINICANLIDIGAWDHALTLARKLPEYHCFSHPRVAKTLCELLNYMIDPIYRECALTKLLNLRIQPYPEPLDSSAEQVSTFQDLQEQVFPMLLAFGPFLSFDPTLLTKFIRILNYMLLKRDDSNQNLLTQENDLYYYLLDVINISILPSVTLIGSNCCIVRELWILIKNFKYPTRYKLYHEWNGLGSNPIILRSRGQLLLRAKHHMKRLSKETLRQSGRNIGKLCYPNPIVILNYVLTQIQSYDNLINLVVDALRYLPPICLDALIYCIIEALSDPHRNKKSIDGMAHAPWLMNVSSFSANIIFRYKVEFTSFLVYIANQLKSGNSLDLILLTDLIQRMTGIETTQAITDERLEAMMGGDVLRTEGAYFNQVKNTRKPSTRIKDALIESRLAMPMCIYIAKLRDRLFFNQIDGTPLKLIGKLYDQCQETLVQYGVFLSMNLSIDDYINFLPPLDLLMTEHQLDPDSAFFLARPMIFYKIKSKFNELKNRAVKELPQAEEGAVVELSSQEEGAKFVEAARSVVDSIAESIQPILAEKYAANNLNSKLFVIFWTLSMSDIEVPLNCYEREIARLKATLGELSKSGDDDAKKRKERERCSNSILKLRQEQSEQIEQTNFVRLYLESEKENLFCENSSYDNVYLESRRFVQHCPFARCILSAHDAIYSAKFMIYLHELQVQNYPTIICIDRLLCDLTYMMGACTENEANHYGRFISHILKITMNWHSSQDIYDEHCGRYPGSIINIDNSEHVTYEIYRDINYKWHYRLTRSFSVALESNNYIQIRNALIVMISIIDHYPAIKHFGKGIGMKIEDVRNQEKESRQDLYALATAYAGRLDDRKPFLIAESNFHIVDVKSSQKDKSSASSSRKKARHS